MATTTDTEKKKKLDKEEEAYKEMGKRARQVGTARRRASYRRGPKKVSLISEVGANGRPAVPPS